jgi:hypothetical protein
MNVDRFDLLTRTLSNTLSRRGLLRGLAMVSSFVALHGSGELGARAKGKKSKLKRNQYGCVNVGGACRGKDSVCCSGICEGKKPKKGEKDKSTCVAHHTSTCTAAHRACTGNPQPSCNPDHPQAICYRTTGQAGFCGLDVIPGCIPCRKDADCHQQLSEGAACVVCSACPDGKGMCIPPGID